MSVKINQMADTDKILKLIRNVSSVRLKQHSRVSQFDVKEIVEINPVLAHWMVIILIAGPSAKITFKSHFKTNSAKGLASAAFQRSPEEVTQEQAVDFMREFCNLTAGGIKASLSSYQFKLAISLPVVTRGFDEIFFTDLLQKDTLSDQWILNSPTGEVICSVTVDMLEELNIANINTESIESEESTIELF